MDNREPRKPLSFLNYEKRETFDSPSVMDVMLDHLEGYVWATENSLKERTAIAQERYDSSDDVQTRDYLGRDLIVVGDIFPHFLRSSFFLLAYSILEYGLKNRCRCTQESKESSTSVDNWPGKNYLLKYRRYLEELCEINADDERLGKWKTLKWNTLQRYQEMRNRIVHNQGHLDPVNTQLMRFVAGNRNLRVVNDEIIFEKGFCEGVIETIREFFQNLDARLSIDCDYLDLESHFVYYDY